jgi:hypothetical protein
MKDLKGCFVFLAIAALAFVIFVGFLMTRNIGDRKEYRIMITDMSTSAQPWIGRVVTLRVKVKSTYSEPYAEIKIQLPDGVKLVEGDLVWRGELAPKKTKTHEVKVCVLSEGDWLIDAQARIWSSGDYTDVSGGYDKAIYFNSTKISPDSFCP